MEITTTPEAEFIDDSAEFFAPAATDMVDGLISQYRVMRGKVERVAESMNGPDLEGALTYFAEYAASQDQRLSASSVTGMFNGDGAIAFLNAAFWSKALQLTDVLDLMPQKRRDEWNEQIRNPLGVKRDKYARDYITPPIPEFNDENVRNTMAALLAQRAKFFAERVDGIFQSLSRTHVTNAPEGFGRRMILANVVDGYGYVNHNMAGVINDLRCVIARFMGREEPKYDATAPVIRYARSRRGEWVPIDGGAMRIRCYLVGTAHLEVHPDMSWRLNAILAQIHPLAIPSQFRERPKKRAKDFKLIGRPLPFAVIGRLAKLTYAQDLADDRGRMSDRWVRVPGCYDLNGMRDAGHVHGEVCQVLQGLGGTPVDQHRMRWAFDYNPLDVIEEIVASGCLPDEKSHQFYPTPRSLAERVVEMANIGPEHSVLEPSAGQGGLADLLQSELTTCVEVSALNAKVLEAKGHEVAIGDFIAWSQSTRGRFDRIVMNPPFDQGRWRAHLEHAADLLRPDGRLVAILPSGARNSGVLPDGFDLQWTGPLSNQFPGVSIDVVILVADRQPW